MIFWIGSALLASGLIYAGLLLFAWATQHHFIFITWKSLPYEPMNANVPAAERVDFQAKDGTPLEVWSHPSKDGKAHFLYFHGNANPISWRGDRLRQIVDAGYGFQAASHRGYGSSEGKPSEQALFSDALQLYDHLSAQTDGPIIIYGESLGTAVATYVASKRPATALVLEAPFSSMIDMARRYYPYLPVASFLRHPFNSISRIASIQMPLLILHGDQDLIVPIRYGRRLFTQAQDPKSFQEFNGAGHINLWEHGSFNHVDRFVRTCVGEDAAG